MKRSMIEVHSEDREHLYLEGKRHRKGTPAVEQSFRITRLCSLRLMRDRVPGDKMVHTLSQGG